jgi:hypothetical protein
MKTLGQRFSSLAMRTATPARSLFFHTFMWSVAQDVFNHSYDQELSYSIFIMYEEEI